jgi:ACS family glucarate transporter-like MFS transporter
MDRIAKRAIALLAILSLTNYLLRMNISIAGKFMMPALGLDEIHMGQVFSAFLIGYTIFQVPGGMLADRLGPRHVLFGAAASWAILTALTGAVAGSVAFASLLAIRFLLGAGEAAMYPAGTRAIADVAPPDRRAFANALMIAGAALGSAFAGPVVASLMVALGWRASFYLMAAVAMLAAIAWRLGAPQDRGKESSEKIPWKSALANRDLLALAASYFLDSYVLYMFVFWLYMYLVDVRKFGILSGGFFTSIPFALATMCVPLCGFLTDRLSLRLGKRRARLIIAMSAFAICAALLWLGVIALSPYLAVAFISISVAAPMSTEGVFWSSATDAGPASPGAAGGVLNTAGNLGGVVSTALVPILTKHFGWYTAFAVAAAASIAGGAIWIFLRGEREGLGK